MNFINKLASKPVNAVFVGIIVTLIIVIAVIPASALNQAPYQTVGDEVVNQASPLPSMISYQGYLTDSGGEPVNDTLEMTFCIYESAEGDVPIWKETQSTVSVIDGLFSVLLGSINPIDIGDLTGVSYLGVQVGTDPEMTPRQRIVSVAYAIRAIQANDANTLNGVNSAEFVTVKGDTMTGQLILPEDGLAAGTDQLVLTDGKVGIGTASPGMYKLQVVGGSINGIYASGINHGVWSYSPGGWGVYGSGGTYGVYGYNPNSLNNGRLGTSNEGVYGEHNATGNYGQLGTASEGVYGSNNNGNYGRLGDTNAGVYGNSSSGYGVQGYSDSNNGLYGNSNSNAGVQGNNANTGNYGWLGGNNEGVYGNSSASYGIYGRSGSSYGVYGRSTSKDGVYGINVNSGHYGRLGTSDEGVYGKHNTSGNYGRLGSVSTGVHGYGSTYGVYGESVSGYGLYGSGHYGVYGGGSYGVYGFSVSGTGVHGYSNSGTGVEGEGGTWDFYAINNNYSPFTGAHEVKLADGFPQDFRPGLIVSVTGETQVRTEEAEINYSSTLPTVQLADTPNDKRVFGVITSESPLPEDHWYQASEGERFGIVNALGEGRVWVTNINGDIEAGDYITTSAIAGYGQKQDDDLLHSYTLGKAIETIDWSEVTETIDYNGQTYKVYAIAVVYTSG